MLRLLPDGLFAGCFHQRRRRLFTRSLAFLGALTAARSARTAAGVAAAALARRALGLGLFLDSHFRRSTFDHRLWSGSVVDDGSSFGNLRSRTLLAAVAALFAVAAVFTRLLFPTLSILLTGFAAWLLLLRLRGFAGHRRLLPETGFFCVHGFEIILVGGIAVAFLEVAAIVTLEAVLHLRLGGCDDAVIVLCVLQIVLGHHAVAGALRIPGKGCVFFGDMLGCAADLHVGAGTVVSPA